MIKKGLWALLFAFVFLIIETALLSNIMVLPVVPDLLLLILLFVSLYNGSAAGEVHGFFSGLMLDFLSASPLGLNSLVRVVVGFCAGIFHNMFNADKIFFPAVLGAAATTMKALLLLVVSLLFGEQIAVYRFADSAFWIELCMNTLLAPPLFAFLRLFTSFLINEPQGARYAAE